MCYYRLHVCAFLSYSYPVLQSKQSDSTLIATWCKANSSSAAHLPAAALESQTRYHKATTGIIPEENLLLPDILHVSFRRCIILRWWSKNTLGSYSKGIAHAFLNNVEVVKGYSEMEQFLAPTCSVHAFFSSFLVRKENFSQSKICLCDLQQQKVTMSERVHCCVSYYLVRTKSQWLCSFNLQWRVFSLPDNVFFFTITKNNNNIDLGSWAASLLVNTKSHKYFILFFLCCNTCSGKHFVAL